MSEPVRHPRSPGDGEVDPDVPSYAAALHRIAEQRTLIDKLERTITGQELEIAGLRQTREERALSSPYHEEIEVIWAVWKKATGKRRPLHFSDRENIAAALDKLGFETCLRALAGARFDPFKTRQRNGKTKTHNDLEIIFRSYGKVNDFAGRAPSEWKPDPEKIAELAGVEAEWVRDRLGPAPESS